jgi:hypothetical protein
LCYYLTSTKENPITCDRPLNQLFKPPIPIRP